MRWSQVGGAFVASALLVLSHGCGSDGTTPSPGVTPSGSPSPGASSVSVRIENGATGKGTAAFGVNPLVVAPGTTVTWTNADQVAHTATSMTGVFDSGTLNQGQSFSFTFNDPGTFPYFCSIHGAASMSGTVQVTQGAQAVRTGP